MDKLFLLFFLLCNLFGFEGVLIPFYHYPSLNDKEIDHLIALKREFPEVKFITIINPNNGTFHQAEPNFVQMIKRLHENNIIIVGYVYTKYGQRPLRDVQKDIDGWSKLYKHYGVSGIFVDEVNCSKWEYYKKIAEAIRKEFDLVISNPGSLCKPEPSWSDITVIHENSTYSMPSIPYRSIKRAVLIHSVQVVTLDGIDAEFIYITDQTLPNPWEKLSKYLPQILEYIHQGIHQSLNKNQVQLQTQSHE